MTQLLVIKASAGSGKTHRLVHEYLKLLFLNLSKYKHILAITFTNKATDEMKSRILSELYKLGHECNESCQKPCYNKSKHLQQLIQLTNYDEKLIREKANWLLNEILHNYYFFSICTIDSFFQQLLRAFMRELGISLNVRIELDVNVILEKSIQKIIDDLKYNKPLLKWMINFVIELIEEGKKWDFRKYLYNMGGEIMTEKFMSLPPEYHQDFKKNIEQQKAIIDQLKKLINKYETDLKQLGKEGKEILAQYNLNPDDFAFKKQGGIGIFLINLADGATFEIKDRLRKIIQNPQKYAANNSPKYACITELAKGKLGELMNKIVSYVDNNSKKYYSAIAILQNMNTFAIISEIETAIETVMRNDNMIVLNKTANFIYKMISKNDVSFIYEKMGQYYQHFMIDEFQDTSFIQWSNIKPLLHEGLSRGNLSLIVGDAKQSIYRWRNTDWKILEYQVKEDLKIYYPTIPEKLDTNWRSSKTVVEFNNDFFSKIKEILQAHLQNDNTISLDFKSIFDLYNDVTQKLPENNEKTSTGYVQILINNENLHNKDSEKQNENNAILNNSNHNNLNYDFIQKHLIYIINKLRSSGYSWRDIVILIRNNQEGTEIIEIINNYNQSCKDIDHIIPVLSAESALLKRCLAIQLIIDTLIYLSQPDDLINFRSLLTHIKKVEQLLNYPKIEAYTPIIQLTHFDFDKNNIELPDSLKIIVENRLHLQTLSLFEVVEYIINQFKLNLITEFIPYIQTFLDVVHQYTLKEPATINSFIDYWQQHHDKFSLEMSDQQDAINIMTIHKAKGLEFLNVIIPYCDWNLNYHSQHSPLLWCKVDPEYKLDIDTKIVPIRYSSNLIHTFFATEYMKEKYHYLLDNLNLLYVAFTRAINNLFILVPSMSKTNIEKTHNEFKLNTAGDILYTYVSYFSDSVTHINKYEKGQLELYKQYNNQKEKKIYPLEKLSITFDFKKIKYKNNNLLNVKNNKSSGHGIIMHQLFQHIRTIKDIDIAVKKMIAEALIPTNEEEYYINFLSELLNSPHVNNWFTDQWKIYNETPVLVPQKNIKRPDRILIKNQHAVVIDYKFGFKPLTTHTYQIKEYMKLLHQMSFKPVEGYIWYINLNKIEPVIL